MEKVKGGMDEGKNLVSKKKGNLMVLAQGKKKKRQTKKGMVGKRQTLARN